MKKSALLFLILSLLLIFAGLHFTGLLSAFLSDTDVGIIGGADRPTANFYINKILNTPSGLLLLFGLPCAFCSLFALIFPRSIEKNCSVPTTATALGLSVCASLGASSLLIFAMCFMMGNPSENPIAFSASICVSMAALIGFILLIALYCKLRGKKPSISGIFIDMAFSIIYTPAFFLTCMTISNFLSELH